MKLVKEIMTPVEQCLFPHNTFLDALDMMKDTKWNTIPVINSTGKLIGVFTRSSLHQMIMENVSQGTIISDYIKKDVGTILEDVNTDLLSSFIMKSRIGTGIVVNKQGEPIGLITKTDAVMNYVQETQFLKEKLEKVLKL